MKGAVMSITGFLAGFFGSKGFNLGKVSVTDLENEKIRLEAEQEKLIKETRKLERRKQELFKEGVGKASTMEKRSVAVQIRQVDDEMKDIERSANVLSRQVMVVGKVLRLKKREKLLKSEGLWGRMTSMDPAQLEALMMDLKVRARQGDATAERLMNILGEEEEEEVAADPAIDEIVKAMEEASSEGLEKALGEQEKEEDEKEKA